MRKKITVENILCLFIIISPILDIISFVFRNTFDTRLSPTTIIRPIIPTILILYLFFKKDKKFKVKLSVVGLIYAVYALIHIYIFSKVKTGMSFGGEAHELQYIINYTFMIINLILYITTFSSNNIEKLKKSVLIPIAIYITSIFIAIITGTSSSTYIEGTGFKGWFESGNSVSAILLLSIFIYLPYVKDKRYRKFVLPVIIAVGIYLSTLIGTRTGLFGFILVLALYLIIDIVYNALKDKKINKKLIFIGLGAIFILILVVVLFGSTTFERRKQLKQMEATIIDNSSNESHLTGSLLKIKENIDNDNLDKDYMSAAQKQSIIDLYNIANKLKITNNDQRTQQLIYNIVLVKNQKNIAMILFGNGYVANFAELVLEMELVAFLLNFGLLGFVLYLGPFVAIFAVGIYKGIKNIKKIDSEYIFLLLGSGMSFAISLLSGYTFFNLSTMIIIVVINTILYDRMRAIKKGIEIYK